MADEPAAFFPEPDELDDTVGRDDETRWDFLRRSTWIRAVETRAFYNAALAELPEPATRAILSAMRAGETESSLLEMLVGRFLQLRGAIEVEYEPEYHRRRIDWRAAFPDGQVHVEAMSPVYNRDAAYEHRRHERLVQLIAARVPPGWWLLPHRLPPLEGHASLRDFRRVAEELIATLPAAESVADDTIIELHGRIQEGNVKIAAYRKDEGGLAGGAMVGYADDSEVVVRRAWLDRGKRKQGRSAPQPALLAIAGSFLGADLDDFERGLLGRDLRFGRDPDRAMVEPDPPWAGVLALSRISPVSADPPVLFMAPGYSGAPLPIGFAGLEERRLGDDGVAVRPAREGDVWAGTRWASMAD